MRRLAAVLLAVLLCVSLCSCGSSSGRPDGVSEGCYNIGLKVIEECDRYLDMDVSAGEAYDSIRALYDRFDEVGGSGVSDGMIESNVLSLSLEMSGVRSGLGTGTYDGVLEKRNKLAGELNEKER